MSEFDRRWQELAGQARKVPATPADDIAPLGFATRVLARRPAPAGPASEDLWLRWLRPSLATMAAVAVVLTGLEVRASRAPVLTRPGIENTVAQVLWKL